MRQRVQAIFSATLRACSDKRLLPPTELEPQLEAPRDPSHGDWATNVALVLQRQLGMRPREIAEILVANLVDPEGLVRSCEIAGPGFINIRLSADALHRALGELLADPASVGRSHAGRGVRVLLEFVSANPTGPLHVGHGRGAVLGDVLGNLLAHAGYDVAREYYINDAGAQIQVLGRSVHLRYQELCGRQVSLPPGAYPGEYVIEIARALLDIHGDMFLDAPEEQWLVTFCDFAIERVLASIHADLDAFGIRFDAWFSERTLVRSRAVERVIERLGADGLVYRGTLPAPKGRDDEDYEPREQLLFRSTAFGDDQDRGLQKADGSYTYFAGDLAYHEDKLARGFATLINVWGADHAGAVTRLQAAIQALSGRTDALEVVMVQLVNLYRDGKPVRMGKRSGNFVALRDVLDEVGRDATRFFFVMRSGSTTLDFDLALAKKQATDNPVFYVQYGYARICGILRHARELGHPAPVFSIAAARRLQKPEEQDLIQRALAWADLVADAARLREPHRVVFYLQETIAAFHSYYTKGRTDASYRVVTPDAELTRARLLLCQALLAVLGNGLSILGVSAPEVMVPPEEEADREGQDSARAAGEDRTRPHAGGDGRTSPVA
jgi:arginyl-tRNA synthetase